MVWADGCVPAAEGRLTAGGGGGAARLQQRLQRPRRITETGTGQPCFCCGARCAPTCTAPAWQAPPALRARCPPHRPRRLGPGAASEGSAGMPPPYPPTPMRSPTECGSSVQAPCPQPSVATVPSFPSFDRPQHPGPCLLQAGCGPRPLPGRPHSQASVRGLLPTLQSYQSNLITVPLSCGQCLHVSSGSGAGRSPACGPLLQRPPSAHN